MQQNTIFRSFISTPVATVKETLQPIVFLILFRWLRVPTFSQIYNQQTTTLETIQGINIQLQW